MKLVLPVLWKFTWNAGSWFNETGSATLVHTIVFNESTLQDLGWENTSGGLFVDIWVSVSFPCFSFLMANWSQVGAVGVTAVVPHLLWCPLPTAHPSYLSCPPLRCLTLRCQRYRTATPCSRLLFSGVRDTAHLPLVAACCLAVSEIPPRYST